MILCCVVAFVGKFVGCAAMARFCGFNLRESGAIGTLMSCKGLVELIVLNIGLQAGILDTRTFSMFVVMALVLTFITTPLTLVFYPPEHRTGAAATDATDSTKKKPSAISNDGEKSGKHVSPGDGRDELRTRISVVLDKVEHLPAIMTLVQILRPAQDGEITSSRNSSDLDSANEKDMKKDVMITRPPARVTIDALRLIELTDRTSAVMMSSAADDLIRRDSLVNIFRTFGRLNRIPVVSALSVVNYDQFSTSVASHAAQADVQLVVVPWTSRPSSSDIDNATSQLPNLNPFETLFGKPTVTGTSPVVHTDFVRRVFADAPADVALVIDRGMADPMSGVDGQHLFLPFFGGPDDRVALALVVQLCMNPGVTATVVRVSKSESLGDDLATPALTRDESRDPKLDANLTIQSVRRFTFSF